MEEDFAKYLLEKSRQDYNLIAPDFSRTRGRIWEELKFLEEYIAAGEKVLDLGCGNGRLYELLRARKADYYGIDVSEKLIEIAKSHYPDAKFQVADALNLPFSDNFFDRVFSIAVFHHIPSEKFRLRFLSEAKRVLRPGGSLVLIVWGLGSRKRLFLFFKYAVFKILGKSKLDFGDTYVPWRKETMRYVHYFLKDELKQLTKTAGFRTKEVRVSKRPTSKESNILLIAEK